MKKLLVLLVLVFSYSLYGHKQHAHQYIATEAYKLLVQTLHYKYPEMQSYLGTFGQGAGSRPYEVGTIASGAWREDEEDIVYGYKDVVQWDNGAISITHFWDPDDGDLTTNIFQLTLGGIYASIGPYENAYMKMLKYINGNWTVCYLYDSPTPCPSSSFGVPQGTLVQGIQFQYSSLSDLINNGTAVSKGYLPNVPRAVWTSCQPSNVTIEQSMRKKVGWEIVGRMCHLLTDMSVPAHVHRDAHGNADNGIRYDSYEDFFGYSFGYNSDSILDTYGGFINANNKTNPVHYLMYTTAQMADHFGSNGPYEGDGNDNIYGNYYTDELTYLNSLNIGSFGSPTGLTNPLSYDQIINIRSKLIPQAIRATAGLLYWFATQAGLYSIPTTTYNLNCDLLVTSGQTFTLYLGDILNLNGYSVRSTGGTIVTEDGSKINGARAFLKNGNSISGIFSSIQTACNYSPDYYSVEVQTGAFTENVSVSGKTNFRLEGKGPANSIIDGSVSFTNMTYPSIQSLKVRNPNGSYLNEIHFTNCDNPSTYNLEGEGGSGTDYMVWTYNCPDLDLTFKSQNASVGFLVQSSYGTLSNADIRNNGQGVGAEEYSSIGLEYTNFCGNTQNYYADQTSSVTVGTACTFNTNCPVSKTTNLDNHIASYSTSKVGPVSIGFANIVSFYETLFKEVKKDIADKRVFDKQKFGNEYQHLIDLSKSFIEKNSNSLEAKLALNYITGSYKKLNELEELQKYLLGLINNKEMHSLNGRAKRHLIDCYTSKKNYDAALFIVDEIVKEQKDDISLTIDALSTKGFIFEYYLNDKSEAEKIYRDVLTNYSKKARFAKNRLSEMGFKADNEQISNQAMNENLDMNNYPNPFNPNTIISFLLKDNGKISLKVYDVLGKEVANLADGYYEAGKHTATFDGSNLASGIYFYRLTTPTATITKKMMLVK